MGKSPWKISRLSGGRGTRAARQAAVRTTKLGGKDAERLPAWGP